MTIIDGDEISNELKRDLLTQINKLNKPLNLSIIHFEDFKFEGFGMDKSKSELYELIKICKELGINVSSTMFNQFSYNELISHIKTLNNDGKVDGIYIQHPIPYLRGEYDISISEIIETVNKSKNISCDVSKNVGNYILNRTDIIPPKSNSVMEFLFHYNIDIEDKNVLILSDSINETSNLLSNILIKNGANVTICEKSRYNNSKYDLIILDVNEPNYLSEIKDDTIVIDFGINNLNNTLVGSVNIDKVSDNISYLITDGNMQKLINISLIRNLIKLSK